MVVGENAAPDDMVVNVVREKQKTNIRTHAADEAIKLTPPEDRHARDRRSSSSPTTSWSRSRRTRLRVRKRVLNGAGPPPQGALSQPDRLGRREALEARSAELGDGASSTAAVEARSRSASSMTTIDGRPPARARERGLGRARGWGRARRSGTSTSS